MINIKRLAVCAVLMSATAAWSQNVTLPSPQNVLQLSADSSIEVQQDQLSMTLSTTRDGSDAASVQTQLKTALDAALTEARKNAQTGQLDVHTGNFSLFPRRSRDGKLTGWQGTAELVLEGRDFPRIAQTAAKISTLTVSNVGFSLSREQQAKSQTEAQALAIDNFKQRADELAKRFGFSGYTLREVSVNAHMGGPIRPRMMAMDAGAKMASADAPVPIEAGTTTVIVNVSGSVQLK